MKENPVQYLDVMKQHFENRKSDSSSYSLRAFARDLKMSPSNLSAILKGKKNISDQMARKISEQLQLNGHLKDIFITSAFVSRTKKGSLKEQSEQKIKKLLAISKTKLIQHSEFEKVNSWMHFAIMELLTMKDCQHTVDWLANKLQLPQSEVLTHLTELEKIEWIVKSGSNYALNFEYSESANDIPSTAIRKYQQSVLKKAHTEIDQQDVHTREYQSVVLGFDKSKMLEAKKFIREFVDQFCLKFAHEEPEKKDSVYQLALQFYTLTPQEKNNA